MDFYYNSWRLVPANVIWGVLLLVVFTASAIWLPLILLASTLAVPVAGMARMAVLIQRERGASFSDFFNGIRHWGLPAFAVGLATTVLALIFTVNIFIGLDMGGLLGMVFSGFALYGDIGLAMFLVAFWPILVDPLRQELPLRRRVWLAVVINVARPGRMFALTFVLVALLVVSTVFLAALLTISVAYASLVSTRYVLPAIDRLEGRPSAPAPE
ncbi:MAG: hypothetical protein M3N29_02330 [Chloroflexota bacterium]|nr:hypothetical protein [Chloroflexota bacterium]